MWRHQESFEAFVSPFPSTSDHLSLRWNGEEQKSLEVIREILQSNFEASSNESNRSNQFAAHRADLMAEDMFDASANARTAPVMDLLLSGQGLIPIPFLVNLRAQVPGLELGFDLYGAIG